MTSRQSFYLAIFVGGFLIIRSLFAYAEVEPAAVTRIKRWVALEYQSYHLDRTDLSLEEKAALLRYAEDVEFSAVAVRGTARNMVMRVEISPNPAMPPSAATIRYFRMRYSLALGWEQMPRPASALSYFLAGFLL